MTKIAVVGAGHAGLGTAIALAKIGHPVTCADIDIRKVDLLNRGRSPIFEQGMDKEVRSLTARGRLRASTEIADVVYDADIIFLVVGTPSREDGSLDPAQVESASRAIGVGLRDNPRQLIVVKSTVTPGTTETVVIPALETASRRQLGEFGVAMNPEFLREGHVVEDSVHPSHIVVGVVDRWSGNTLLRLFSPFKCPKLRTSIRVAEAVKYATNAFLATKVTFANELANLSAHLGLDSDEVIRGMTMDPRINPQHFVPGVGFGGSCFPKDIRALVSLARSLGREPALLSAVLAVNERQYFEAVRLLEDEIGPLEGKRIALLGLAFKAGTDDVRESRALAIASELILRGARVIGYDPKAGENFARALSDIKLAKTPEDALRDADGCIIQATWPEIVRLGPKQFSLMATPVVVDGRRTWTKARVPKGIRYRRIG